ncbi:Golgi transport complex domain-containing protein [Salix suchowensis]|nr:Golgi transport complex domain-containing protein [Salix suchowensis]
MLYRSRVRTEPTNLTVPQYTAALWSRLENMIEEMAGCCDKVYTLEKVLKIKKDTVTHVVFLDETMKPVSREACTRYVQELVSQYTNTDSTVDWMSGSSFLQQTLSIGYPRLLRLFHEFFAKIAALAGGTRNPPGVTEGTNVARAVVNELDSARFDPLLVRSVAKNAATSLDMMLTRIDPLANSISSTNHERSDCQFPVSLLDAATKLASEYTDSVYAILKPSIDIIDPMLTSVRREVAAIIARLHRIDLSKSIDSMTGLGGASIYMKDLVEKLAFVKAEILPTINIGEITKPWVVSIVQYVIRTFVLHVSIAKPLGESGKLQLTSDMTELEFALNALMVDRGQNKRGGDLETVGEDYRTLRALRRVLIGADYDFIGRCSSSRTTSWPSQSTPRDCRAYSITSHPCSVTYTLPHSLHGWQEAEYVRWVDEHSDAEAWTLVESGLAHWEKISGSKGKEKAVADEYIRLARTVLGNVKI